MSLVSVPNFSTYLTTSGLTDPWGVSVSGVGHARVAPREVYPPSGHPAHHQFNWQHGRVLNHFQIVYITDGQGIFESVSGGVRDLPAGSVFLLFPGVWHRYQPRHETGWVEDWIEMNGPSVERLTEAKVISPEQPHIQIGLRPEIHDLFYECFKLARSGQPGYQPTLGVLGLQILTRVLAAAGEPNHEPSSADRGVERARAIIAQAIDQPVRMEEIAEDVGMGYSHFRRTFRAKTGLSPKQYHLQLRMRKAQAMLQNTSMSLCEIADSLGFDSPFHLSSAFKAKMGVSPSQWRTRVLAERDPAA
jgi:AraC-like DNA-binding protein